MLKLIKDMCTKIVFSYNDALYEQLNGVRVGNSLCPVLANIIMKELEKITIKPLIDSINVLMVIKPEEIDRVHCAWN